MDTIDSRNFIAPVVVVDGSAEVAKNPDWLLTVEHLEAWEAKHGRIPAGAWVAFRTDWSKRISDPAAYVNMKEDGAHTPGPTQAAVEFLVDRQVHGFAVETINTDAGQSYAWPVAYPCHTLMHGANPLDQNFGFTPTKPLLNPTQAAAAQSEYDPSALPLPAGLRRLQNAGSTLRVQIARRP